MMIAVVTAPRNELTAIPPSSNVVIENLPPTEAIKNTTAIVIAEPRKANNGKNNVDTAISPEAIAATAPTAPPLETPIIPGSAIELRNNPCMMPPEIPSAAPAINARKMRGNRMLLIIACSVGSATDSPMPARLSKVEAVFPKEILSGPTAAETIATSTEAMLSTSAPTPNRLITVEPVDLVIALFPELASK